MFCLLDVWQVMLMTRLFPVHAVLNRRFFPVGGCSLTSAIGLMLSWLCRRLLVLQRRPADQLTIWGLPLPPSNSQQRYAWGGRGCPLHATPTGACYQLSACSLAAQLGATCSAVSYRVMVFTLPQQRSLTITSVASLTMRCKEMFTLRNHCFCVLNGFSL